METFTMGRSMIAVGRAARLESEFLVQRQEQVAVWTDGSCRRSSELLASTRRASASITVGNATLRAVAEGIKSKRDAAATSTHRDKRFLASVSTPDSACTSLWVEQARRLVLKQAPAMSSPPSFRRSRVERASSLDLPSSSLFRRLQGKKSSHKMSADDSLAASLPPPRHSHRRILSRDRKRPTVIYYSSRAASAASDFEDSKFAATTRSQDSTVFTDGELSEDDYCATPNSQRIGKGEDRFEADSKLPDFAASMGPRDTLARSRGAFMRMSHTFSRASERVDDGRREHRRAARQSAKYDVAWRQDDESECCQVCFAMFTKLSRRRHHCRVCGELVCGACSQDQVSLTDKFATPRRACVACCSLLQAMARAGDDRVKVVEPDMTAVSQASMRHHQSAPVAATYHSPGSAAMPAPAATPRFRDRLTEVHRVMAAGKLSRRRGSLEKKMFVISSRWLRSWLAFTSSTSSSSSSRNLDYGFDAETSISSPSAKDDMASMGRAPGPIDNLSLLELSRGKLVPRAGLIRDEVIAGEAASSVEDADFQLLSPEVWEVFQRLYGGAPAIYVNLTSADPTAWIIDVSGLLVSGTHANGTKVQVLPAVERALTTRHHNENDFVDVRGPRTGSNQARTPTESGSFTPVGSRFTVSNSKQQPPKSPAWTVTSSSSSSSLAEDKDRIRSPVGSGKMQLEDLEAEVATLSVAVNKTPTEGEYDMRATTSTRSPTAALAASAFAVAMKQARLNAQKAIDDRASRVIAA
jgi:hypothetical protein